MKIYSVIGLCFCLCAMGWNGGTRAVAMDLKAERRSEVKNNCPTDVIDIIVACSSLIDKNEEWCRTAPDYITCLEDYKAKCPSHKVLDEAIQSVDELMQVECI